MRLRPSLSFAHWLALGCAIGAITGGCSSGSGPSSTRSEPDLVVDDLSVGEGATWKLNRPIDIHFNLPIDFSTINFNTIHIATLDGRPATGSFVLVDDQTVRFQPACPTRADNSDAGFLPGGTAYRLNVIGSGSGGTTVRSENGKPLEQGISVRFVTPISSDPQALFLDTVSGPPFPRVRGRSGVPTDAEDATYVELGSDSSRRIYFVWDSVNQVGKPEDPDFTCPLNLYSTPEDSVAILLSLNQPLNPADENITSDFVQIEYLDDGAEWQPVATLVSLEANCTEAGARLRLEPVGLLPQETSLRLIIREGFADLVGDKTLLDTTGFAQFSSSAPDHFPGDDADQPAPFADELLESFSTRELEDKTASFAVPHADWDAGILRASFPFSGTGGPNGNFDWFIPAGTEFILDTTSAMITGGPGGDPSATEVVINGVVDVRHLFIPADSKLVIQGPNPCTILLTGTATIEGQIILSGSSSRGVSTLNTTNIPEPGAAGNAGGGRGGTGSYLTNQSTPRGGNGQGPFAQSNLGGEGGETSYAGGDQVNARRGAGGGGGVFGHDVYYQFDDNDSELVRCQELVGMDAEPGFGGGIEPGKGAVTQADRAQGGALGQSPFLDGDPSNDFLGAMLTVGGDLVVGELASLWAGAGGGGGGDAVSSDSFPLVPFLITGDEKGSGGGGGAGGLRILAIGPIEIVSPSGRIVANGGQGGGGENTSGFNRVGGGSGGGSGGHIVLSSASYVSIEGSVTGAGDWYNDDDTTGHLPRMISALGGQGGAGHSNKGGSKQNGEQVLWKCDAVPIPYFLVTDPKNPPFEDAECWTTQNMPDQNDDLGPCLGAGGDGGPGIFQIHVDDPGSDILFPDIGGIYGEVGGAGIDVSKVVAPPPQGWRAPEQGEASDRMIPFYGPESIGRSNWIALGLARVKAGEGGGVVDFYFDGTDTDDGTVVRSAVGGPQAVLDPIIGPVALAQEPATPYIVADDPLTIVLDASGLVDDDLFYKRNPALLRLFRLHLEDSVNDDTVQEHEVVSATYDATDDVLRVTVEPANGEALADFQAVGSVQVSLVPYFFRLNTNGAGLSYPADSEITILFEGTTADSEGNPDELASTGTLTDIDDLDLADYDFFRFQVSFNLSSSGGSVTPSTPRPGIEFLRIPFRLTRPTLGAR